MILRRRSLAIVASLALALVLTATLEWGCKKSNPVDNSTIDSKLVGAWYNQSDSVGIEILSDGTVNNLDVSPAGILRYAVVDTINGALLLRIESARSGAISIQGTYRSRKVDSTYIATGTYAFSPDYNTLTLTLLLPLNGSSQTSFVYVRSSIGVKVSASVMDRDRGRILYSRMDEGKKQERSFLRSNPATLS